MVYKVIHTGVLAEMELSGFPLSSVSATPAPAGRPATSKIALVAAFTRMTELFVEGKPVITVVLVDPTGTVMRTCGIWKRMPDDCAWLREMVCSKIRIIAGQKATARKDLAVIRLRRAAFPLELKGCFIGDIWLGFITFFLKQELLVDSNRWLSAECIWLCLLRLRFD